LAGAAAFFLFALVLEQGAHTVVLGRFALRSKPVLYVLYGVLMAGLFEETARFISFHILKKRYNVYGINTGLSYGIGHGGIEAILLAGIAMIANIVYGIMMNAGALDEGTLGQVAVLASTAPVMFLVAGLERLSAIAVHISLSVLVFYAVSRRDKWWLYPAAILLHALVDVPAVLMQIGVLTSTALVEVIVCVFAVVLILLARITHKKLRQKL
jgi:uncharacterized membrane protein YhfC